MSAVGIVPPTPIYHSAPPEVHSLLLNGGATAAGVVAAGTSWSHVALEYEAGIAELEMILASVQANYQGPSAEQFVAAHQPLLMWMADVAIKATLAAVAHGEIGAAFTTAVALMPTMVELMNNHFDFGVLVGTNFMGVNTIPIGLNVADYTRMWNQAADVQTTWDGTASMALDSIPDTPPSPMTLMVGMGEAGDATASAASFATTAAAGVTGAQLSVGDAMGTTLLAQKVATSPLSASDGASQAQDTSNQAGQQLKPENMGNVVQQFASSAPSAVSSAVQGPMSMLMSAPQQLASAPQQLSGMLSQFAGGLGGNAPSAGSAFPIGFPGTAPVAGINPAGMTSLAGGALGGSPSRPLMPSSWGSTPSSAAESATNPARLAPVAAGMPGAGASGSGAGGSGGMMGHGANKRRSTGAQQVTTYADDEDDEVGSDGGAHAMTR